MSGAWWSDAGTVHRASVPNVSFFLAVEVVHIEREKLFGPFHQQHADPHGLGQLYDSFGATAIGSPCPEPLLRIRASRNRRPARERPKRIRRTCKEPASASMQVHCKHWTLSRRVLSGRQQRVFTPLFGDGQRVDVPFGQIGQQRVGFFLLFENTLQFPRDFLFAEELSENS